jgi:hypothetical protein
MLPQCQIVLVSWGSLTLLRVLPGHLRNSIANLIPDGSFGLCTKCLEKFLSDGGGLVLGQSQEHVDGLACIILARLGGNAPKDDGGKGSRLRSRYRG